MNVQIMWRAPVMLLAMLLMIAGAHANETDTATLIRLEHQWLHAIETRDTAFLNKLLAEDFVDISTRGEVRHKADVLRSSVTPASTTQTLSDMSVREYGDSAVVTGLNTVSDRHGAWTVRVHFTDVFIKRGDGWQTVSAQETLERQPAEIKRN